MDEVSNEHNQIISSRFGDGTTYLSSTETGNIETKMRLNTWDGLLNTKKYIDTIRDVNWKWMTLNPATSSNNGFWIQEFSKWLEWMKDKKVSWTNNDTVWNSMIKRWNDDNNKNNRTLENMFKKDESNNVKAYADFFGLNLSSNTWEQLKNADISKK